MVNNASSTLKTAPFEDALLRRRQTLPIKLVDVLIWMRPLKMEFVFFEGKRSDASVQKQWRAFVEMQPRLILDRIVHIIDAVAFNEIVEPSEVLKANPRIEHDEGWIEHNFDRPQELDRVV